MPNLGPILAQPRPSPHRHPAFTKRSPGSPPRLPSFKNESELRNILPDLNDIGKAWATTQHAREKAGNEIAKWVTDRCRVGSGADWWCLHWGLSMSPLSNPTVSYIYLLYALYTILDMARDRIVRLQSSSRHRQGWTVRDAMVALPRGGGM